jgi:hypothetical protein
LRKPISRHLLTLLFAPLYFGLHQGETSTVRDLLGLHADGRDPSSPSGVLRALLDVMPVMGAGDGITEFLRQWKVPTPLVFLVLHNNSLAHLLTFVHSLDRPLACLHECLLVCSLATLFDTLSLFGVCHSRIHTDLQMWQKACRDALQGGSLGENCEPEYELMLRLVAGDVGAFDTLKVYADMWCQLLVARLLYTNPLARFFDLQVDVDWARGVMSSGGAEDPVQQLYYHIMNLDPLALIKGSCECFDAWSWWLPVHLIDILIGLKVKFGGHANALRE